MLWILTFGLLYVPDFVGAFTDNDCYVTFKDGFSHEGDVTLGAFFPLHIYYTTKNIPVIKETQYYQDVLAQYKFKNYHFVLALVFAIEEVNRNPHLLPNTTLGSDLYNVASSEMNILIPPIFWLTRMRIPLVNYNCVRKRMSPAALTGTSMTISAQIGNLLQLYKVPQLTFGPFDPVLNDPDMFKFLYQMAPKDTSLSLAIVSLMFHFNWSCVGVFLPDDHRGTQFLSGLRKSMESKNICIAFLKMIPGTWNSFSSAVWKNLVNIQESSANVIVIYGTLLKKSKIHKVLKSFKHI